MGSQSFWSTDETWVQKREPTMTDGIHPSLLSESPAQAEQYQSRSLPRRSIASEPYHTMPRLPQIQVASEPQYDNLLAVVAGTLPEQVPLSSSSLAWWQRVRSQRP